MQGKVYPPDLHRVVFFQLLNTHGTEVTPGSDVVGKDVESQFLHDELGSSPDFCAN